MAPEYLRVKMVLEQWLKLYSTDLNDDLGLGKPPYAYATIGPLPEAN